MVNLRGARERAMDSRVASALGQVRVVAEMIKSRYHSYANLCVATSTSSSLRTTRPDLLTIAAEIDANNGATVAPAVCFVTATEYCVSTQLIGGTGLDQYWCVRSDGRAGRADGQCSSATACLGL